MPASLPRPTALLVVIALVGSFLLPAWGCGSDEESGPKLPPDKITYELFPSTIVLEAGDLSDMEPDKGDGLLSFATLPRALADAKPGTVFIAPPSPVASGGMLRVVLERRHTGTGVVLETAQAPLQFAFKSLHVEFSRSYPDLSAASGSATDPLDGQQRQPLVSLDPRASIPLDNVLFDGDGDPTTTDDRLELKGLITGGVRFTFKLDFDWDVFDDLPEKVIACFTPLAVFNPLGCVQSLIPEAKVVFTVSPHVEAEANLIGVASVSFDEKYDAKTIRLPMFPVGPLTITPLVDITGRVEGGASARFKMGVRGEAELESAFSGSNRSPPQWEPFEKKKLSFEETEREVTLHAHVKATVGVKLTLLVYDTAGPRAGVDVWGKIEADPFSDPCWEVSAGADAMIGVRIQTPELPLVGAVTLFKTDAEPFNVVTVVLADGSCELPGDPPPAPGTGPTDKTLQTPEFEPWTVELVGAADGSYASSPLVERPPRTELSQTVDGRFVVAGEAATSVVKLTNDGAVVWAGAYSSEVGAVRPLGITAFSASTLGVLTRSPDDRYGVLGIGQSGTPGAHATIQLPVGLPCLFEPRFIERAPGRGSYVVGGCLDDSAVVVIRAGPEGFFQDGILLTDSDGTRRLQPTAVVRDGDVLVVAGSVRDDETMFLVRLDRDLSPVVSARYDACDDLQGLEPMRAVPGPNGDVDLVGSAGSRRNSFLARIKGDGRVGFAHFAGFGIGLAESFVADAFVPLHSTGYVMSGSTVDLTAAAGTHEATPSLAVALLDATGRVNWARSLSLRSGGAYRPTSLTDLVLTDDGGFLAASLAAGEDGSTGGYVVAKGFARDGTMAIDPAHGEVHPIAVKGLDCSLRAIPWTVGTKWFFVRSGRAAITGGQGAVTGVRL